MLLVDHFSDLFHRRHSEKCAHVNACVPWQKAIQLYREVNSAALDVAYFGPFEMRFGRTSLQWTEPVIQAVRDSIESNREALSLIEMGAEQTIFQPSIIPRSQKAESDDRDCGKFPCNMSDLFRLKYLESRICIYNRDYISAARIASSLFRGRSRHFTVTCARSPEGRRNSWECRGVRAVKTCRARGTAGGSRRTELGSSDAEN
jgi:hypothetical protein